MMMHLQDRIRGWSVLTFGVETTGAILAKLDEEVAELRGATEDGRRYRVQDELADVMIVLAKIANAYGVDLARAAEIKMDANERRTWQRDGRGVMRHVESGEMR